MFKILIFTAVLMGFHAHAEDTFDDKDLNVQEKPEEISKGRIEANSKETMTEEELKDFLEDYYSRPFAERFKFKTQMRGRIRHDDRTSGDSTFRVQPRLEIGASMDLTNDGCLKAVGEGTTGNSYASDWDDFKTGTRDEDLNFHLRTFYLDYEMCNMANIHIELGYMPVDSEGYLGPDSSGWTDGVRVRYITEDGNTLWALTVGESNAADDPSLFERSFDGDVNLKQVSMVTGRNKKIEFLVDIMDHVDNVYIRTGMTYKFQSNKLIDKVTVENLLVDGKQGGAILNLEKKFGKWKLNLAGVRIEELDIDQRLPLDGFLGASRKPGTQTDLQAILTFRLSKKCSWLTRALVGQSPTRAETGFVCKF